MIRPDGSEQAYAYDAGDNLIRIYAPGKSWTFTRDIEGLLTKMSNGSFSTVYGYDAVHRITGLDYQSWGKTLAYADDKAGNRTSMTDNLGLHAYGYDKLDRLISAKFPSGRSKKYSYDPVGNRTKLVETFPHGDPGPVTTNYAYDAADRIQSAGNRTFTSDALGRMSEDRKGPDHAVSFAYGGFGRPVRIGGLKHHLRGHDLPDSEYSYAPLTPALAFSPAPLGSRLTRKDSQGVTKFIVDQNTNIVAELKADNTPRTRCTHTLDIDEPLGMLDENGHAYYMLPDGLGSTAMLIDEQGDPVQIYNYEPFGKPNVTTHEANSLRYTGKPYDADAQLQNNGARYLDPSLGRWTTGDPLAFAPAGNLFEKGLSLPQTMSRCGYVANRPLNFADPHGKRLVLKGPHAGELYSELKTASKLRVARDGATGELSLPCGTGQPGTGNVLGSVVFNFIREPEEFSINVSGADKGIRIDDFILKTIDWADLEWFFKPTPSPRHKETTTGGEVLTHIFYEYYLGWTLGKPYSDAHNGAIQFQNGYRRSIGQKSIIMKMENWATSKGSDILIKLDNKAKVRIMFTPTNAVRSWPIYVP